MEDSKGNEISLGDRVKFLWKFDNRMHEGRIVRIGDKLVEIDTMVRKISIHDPAKLIKIPENPR